jgi:hypothetical protein
VGCRRDPNWPLQPPYCGLCAISSFLPRYVVTCCSLRRDLFLARPLSIYLSLVIYRLYLVPCGLMVHREEHLNNRVMVVSMSKKQHKVHTEALKEENGGIEQERTNILVTHRRRPRFNRHCRYAVEGTLPVLHCFWRVDSNSPLTNVRS